MSKQKPEDKTSHEGNFHKLISKLVANPVASPDDRDEISMTPASSAHNAYVPSTNPLVSEFWEKMNLQDGDPGFADLEDDELYRTMCALYRLGAVTYLAYQRTALTVEELDALKNAFSNGIAHGIECAS
ncbi:MAG: hypothetical protein EOO52_13250 [Gammaproteobacteria bacterium]|nr:MAG: hypothetical protein EOO52_13250 [Gammaproteobacteria bacterium]